MRNNGEVQFTLKGQFGVTYVIESSTNLQNWDAVSTVVSTNNYGTPVLITVPESTQAGFLRARRGPAPMFSAALTAWSNISFLGNSSWVDSYDSMDPNYSTNGQYDHLKRKATGDVKFELGLIEIDNAKINGKIRTGPNGGYIMGTNGFVGDLNWTGPGVQPGWYAQDFQFCFPDIELPISSFIPPVSGPPGGTNLYLMGSGDYIIDGKLSTKNKDNIEVIGNVRLYITGDVLMQGQSTITIAEGASLDIYVAGGSAVFTSVNTTGNANTFRYFDLPTNTNVLWAGNATYVGCVYAPQATVICGGGGSSIYDFQGAIVAKSLGFNGHFKIHFDEGLLRGGPMR